MRISLLNVRSPAFFPNCIYYLVQAGVGGNLGIFVCLFVFVFCFFGNLGFKRIKISLGG